MGMFDYVQYEGKEYQSKDTPNQLCDRYKIERDHQNKLRLYYEAYKAKWVNDDSTPLGHRLETWDHHWIHCDDFDGLIHFYRQDKEHDAWIEFKALFMDGVVLKIGKINNEV